MSELLSFLAGACLVWLCYRGQKVVHPEYMDNLAKRVFDEYPPPTDVPDLIVKTAAAQLHLRKLADAQARGEAL